MVERDEMAAMERKCRATRLDLRVQAHIPPSITLSRDLHLLIYYNC